jgi:ATP-dependent Zn protease
MLWFRDALGKMVSGRLFGRIRPDIDSPARSRRVVERELISLFAGHAAETIFLGRSSRSSLTTLHASDDFQRAVALAQNLCGSDEEVEAYLHWLTVRASNLIEFHWSEVEIVAGALSGKRTINGKEVRALIREARRGLDASASS